MLKTKNNVPNQNDIPDADSDDDGYTTAEEEILTEFHESHQYVRWELPPNPIEFYPMSSPFALHGVPYKFKSSPVEHSAMLFEPTNDQKKSKPKKTWVRTFLHGLKPKKASSPLIDDSNTPHNPKKAEKKLLNILNQRRI